MNRKQLAAIRAIAKDWRTVCFQTAMNHNMTPEEAYSDPALTADFLADELGRLLNGPRFTLQRNARGYDGRKVWNDAVYILTGCFPGEMQIELVHLLTDAPKQSSFSIRTVKKALKKLIGVGV